jgi:hypothetical protein
MRVKRGSDQYLILKSEFRSEKTARTGRLLPPRIRIQNSELSHWSDSLSIVLITNIAQSKPSRVTRTTAVPDYAAYFSASARLISRPRPARDVSG